MLSRGDHQHGIPASGNHTHSDAGHAHSYDYVATAAPGSGELAIRGAGGGTAITNTRTGYASLSASGNIGPTATYLTSQAYGIPAVTVGYVSAVGIPAVTVNNTGSGTPHNTLPPFAVVLKIIKY
jgi:hypothetical protein